MSKTILIVDDSASVRHVVSEALSAVGYNVIEAEDGKDGLAKLNTRRVHLIISDVNMPNMDGISMAKEIKQNPQHKFTPIVMLTTEGDDKTKQAGKAAGVRAWMVKPFKPEQMIQAVKTLVP
ncbi:chemotaxis protein CheY [Oleiphilus messinensis]|uniref:Chemotaxis protein CheY n=1 Tax=Oleiphilus messinensis TaxID=141451 RepID=A0A1Y0I8S6_9GAMM|nr:response regulator [Oleiphilus messinensis]ARU56917.1 chemotaxis protein CheY [Oleiphilus messinensis]